MALSTFRPAPPGAEDSTCSGVVDDGLTISKALEKSDLSVSNGIANPKKAIEEMEDDTEALTGKGVCAGGEAPATETPKVSTSGHSAFLSGEVELRESLDPMEVEIPACNGVVPEEPCRGQGDADEFEVRGSLQSSPPPSMNGASGEGVEQKGRHSNKRKWSYIPSGLSSAVSSNRALGSMVR